MGTVDRVLPWRRLGGGASSPAELAPLVGAFRRRHPRSPITNINRAYRMASEAHQSQMRKSGESYINHPLAVAQIVAEIVLDEVSVAAALLHDAVEDTEITLENVEADFGVHVAQIVDGVTKLERIRFDSREEQQAATMRKMLVAMARDLRVLVIKLADRLHNMRTIAAMPLEKQQRIAQETLDIYAPLAHRLGMQEIRQQLEDLSFASLHPKRFAELDHLVRMRMAERDVFLAAALAEVRQQLGELRIDAEVTGRGKHLWSIYEKMVVKGLEFDDIFDLVAVRVIVPTIKDCYAALGCIHGRWRPVVGRFKDYIAMPKFNLYQSLHTTVIGPSGKPIEVQIRTHEMHQRAEWGVAAHWAYKDGSSSPTGEPDWLTRIVDWQEEVSDPAQFMSSLKTDLDQDEIYVFTPKGKVITLPVGSTPVDFAYSVHTEVGHATIGTKVNDRMVPLDHVLVSGDKCEIFTSKVESAGPSQDWLGFVASQRARNKIRQWFSRERRLDMIEAGRDDLTDQFRRLTVPLKEVWKSSQLDGVIDDLGYVDLDALLAAVGEHHVSAEHVAQKVKRGFEDGETEVQVPATVETPRRRRREGRREVGVHVEGLDDMLVRMAHCCTPVPGDAITGYVTRGRGVSVHRADCANAVAMMAQEATRMIEVEWDGEEQFDSTYTAAIEVVALDRSRLLRDVANALADHQVNILSCETVTSADREAKMRFEFELANPQHLESVIRTMKGIDSVYEVYRTIPGAASVGAAG
ncbi:MAG: bifunctional (p)ppGpp synthetase/guanosine-3',5'-bis(diphosphate) 3'-pyrophosphohydrolase [Actinomycetota bacterium]